MGFEVLEGGSGYSEESLSFKVVTTIQNIVTGEEALVETRFNYNNQGELTSTDYYIPSDIAPYRFRLCNCTKIFKHIFHSELPLLGILQLVLKILMFQCLHLKEVPVHLLWAVLLCDLLH